MRQKQVSSLSTSGSHIHRVKSADNVKREVRRTAFKKAARLTKRIQKGNQAEMLAWLDDEDRIERFGFSMPDEITEHFDSIRVDGMVAREEFAECTRDMAPLLIKRHFRAPMSALKYEEIVDEANLILAELIISGEYDFSKGSFFNYYKVVALPKLYKHYNMDGVIKHDSEHVHIRNELSRVCAAFFQEHEREAQYDEQVKMLPGIVEGLHKKPRKSGYTVQDVAFYHGICPVVSLEKPIDEDGTELKMLLEAPESAMNDEEYRQVLDSMDVIADRLLATLSPRDASILIERGLDERYRMTLEEIAHREGVTKQRVSQICAEARRKMVAGGGDKALRDAARRAAKCAALV